MTEEKINWQWWAGSDDERYTIGPCDSREQAFQEGQDHYSGEGFHIVEAVQASDLRLALQFNASDFLENVEDRVYDDYTGPDGEPVFVMSKAQVARLQSVVRSAIEAWQCEENLTFKGWKFQRQRNEEFVPCIDVEVEDEPASA
jgi:hypothetical protein